MPSFEKRSFSSPTEKAGASEELDTSFADMAEGRLYEEPSTAIPDKQPVAPENLPGADEGTLEEVRERLAQQGRVKESAPVDDRENKSALETGILSPKNEAEIKAENAKSNLFKRVRPRGRQLLGNDKLTMERATETNLDWQVHTDKEQRAIIPKVAIPVAGITLLGGMIASLPEAGLNTASIALTGQPVLVDALGASVGMLAVGAAVYAGTYLYHKLGKERGAQSQFKKLYGRKPKGMYLPR